MNNILDVLKLSKLATTSGKSGKSASAKFANVGIVKNTVAISLYTNCHSQKTLLKIFDGFT